MFGAGHVNLEAANKSISAITKASGAAEVAQKSRKCIRL